MQKRILHTGMSQRYFTSLTQPQLYQNKRGLQTQIPLFGLTSTSPTNPQSVL
jgi:hypothetical protein